MKFIFFVQGEGRGHMTQAITLAKILNDAGHKVSRILVGKSHAREIPPFFYEKINAPVETFESPNFTRDSLNKGVRISATIFNNIAKAGKFFTTIKRLKKIIEEENPDGIINFYELLAGMVFKFYNPGIPMYCIGHQYLILHPEFPFPKGRFIDKYLLKLNTRLTSSRARLKLALSFSHMPSVPKKQLFVVPPLLRPEVLALEKREGDYILGYILNSGYADEIIRWHKRNPEQKLHFYWDHQKAEKEYKISSGLTFHKISDLEFINHMISCRGFASTAGFESICEAMYFDKPVFMVPTAGHFEQECNAHDAHRTGAGIFSNTFDLSGFEEFIRNRRFDHSEFKNWVSSAPGIFLRYLTTYK